MKKIMKRLLTGVLTLATVFTTLPVTQVHAADSVYTTTDGKAGTIVKIDNGGSEVSSFEESIMNADGQIAYCIDINTNFQSGYKNRINATDVKIWDIEQAGTDDFTVVYSVDQTVTEGETSIGYTSAYMIVVHVDIFFNFIGQITKW